MISKKPTYEELKQRVQELEKAESERKRAEQALRVSGEMLGETARIAKVGGWEIDLRGNTLAWTEEAFRIHELVTDYPPDVAEAIQFYHPDDQAKVAAAVKRAMDSGEAFDIEARLITAKKNQRWARAIGKALYRDGRLAGIRGMVQDITEHKRVVEALRASETYIKAVMDSLPIGVAVNSVDPDVTFSYMNENFPKFYRTKREALTEPDVFWDSIYEDPVFPRTNQEKGVGRLCQRRSATHALGGCAHCPAGQGDGFYLRPKHSGSRQETHDIHCLGCHRAQAGGGSAARERGAPSAYYGRQSVGLLGLEYRNGGCASKHALGGDAWLYLAGD